MTLFAYMIGIVMGTIFGAVTTTVLLKERNDKDDQDRR